MMMRTLTDTRTATTSGRHPLPCRHGASRSASGFSLVELMVSVVISGLLVLGITSTFMSTSRTYDVQLGVQEIVEKGRVAMANLTRDVRQAGYRDTNWAAGAITGAVAATDGTSDTLTVRYEAAQDCNRVPAAPPGIVTNVYDVVGGALRCNGQVLMDGIDEMQVFFGEDIDGDGVANRLMAPGAAGLTMSRVVTVNVSLLAASDHANVSTGKTLLTLPWWSQATVDAPDDGRIRREFSQTIAVRNLL